MGSSPDNLYQHLGYPQGFLGFDSGFDFDFGYLGFDNLGFLDLGNGSGYLSCWKYSD